MASGPPNTVEEGALAPGLAVGPTGPTGFATAYANNYSCASEMAACNVAALLSVSCATATSCEAVGTVGNSQVVQGPLGEGWNGTSWTIQPPPPPSTLTGVSCTLATACMAVGYGYNGSSYELVPVAASWDGSTWTIRPPPSPSNAAGAVLAYVQCATANACMAVGQYTPTGSEAQPLIEFWNGSVWTIQAAPLPSGESGGSLYGVSCPSTTTCTAVGSYFTSAGGPTEELALAESWNGTSWSVQPTAATMPLTSSSLNAVWCLSAASCEAVGRIYTGSGEETLAESWNGTSWSIQPTPNPSGSTFSYFANISCAPAGTPCKAVGSSGNETLVESWDGTSWSTDTTPKIPNATESSFSDVSCTSTIACTAVGYYLDNTVGAQGARLTLAERWNGTNWTAEQTPDPPVVETEAATSLASTSATVVGNVWPERANVTGCYFEYGTSYPYSFTAPCSAAVGAGTAPVSVSADLSGLTPSTTYYAALVATNAGGTATDHAPISFTTPASTPGPPPPGGSPPSGGPPPGGCPGSQPAICAVTPGHGPAAGGTAITVYGAGFEPGDRLCFWTGVPVLRVGPVCASDTQIVSSTEIHATTPSFVSPNAFGPFNLGIQRCCSGLSLLEFVSSVSFNFFPPPPPPPPPASSCDIFSIGSNACWRVGAGAVASWFTSVISSAFAPNRNPDFVVLQLAGSSGYGRGPTGSWQAIVTCSGDMFVQPSVGYSFIGGGLPLGIPSASVLNVSAVLGLGYVGTPGNALGSLTEGDVDGFVNGFTADISVGFVNGMTFIISPKAPGPHTGIEYWQGASAGIALTGGYSFLLGGPDPSENSGTPCPDITTTSTWHTLAHYLFGAPALAAAHDSISVVTACTAPGGCSGTAEVSVGATAASNGRARKAVKRGPVLGKASYSIPGSGFRRITIGLGRHGQRLLARGHGVLRATLTITESSAVGRATRSEPLTIEAAPTLSKARQSAARWRERRTAGNRGVPVGTVFSFTLNEPAQMMLLFNPHGVSRTTQGPIQWSFPAHAGANTIHFNGLIGKSETLASGSYTVTFRASNATGAEPRPRLLHFQIAGS